MKPTIDFNRIEPHQAAIHERLVNWSDCYRVRYGGKMHPMWRYFKSGARQWHQPEMRKTVDTADAAFIEKQMRHLPTKHREVLVWFYFDNATPAVARRAFGLPYDSLYRHLRDCRQMVINLVDRSAA